MFVIEAGAASRWIPAILLGSVLAAACPAASHPAEEAVATPQFPSVGLAVRDSTFAWCAAFPTDSAASARPSGLAIGEPVAVVFADIANASPLRANIARRRSTPCPAAFPQPRWESYTAYDLALVEPSHRQASSGTPDIALAVASTAQWVRGSDGHLRADLDGDGDPEEVRQCAADEGQHFTVWSHSVRSGEWRRVAHEYYDWGVEVEPNCRPGEDGRDSMAVGMDT